ncbi:Ger(x)C family germination protein [Caldicoprobacter guelmensis]|uniref:Ger(x)C family spore germination protein n=1 Tax=Caldicoprobacter guelmensis TaxID=1170224 RepID=UPI00195AD3F5|nr:Ger(x)C family spore germination protein [Caldicoprobacter guelmensis]MBM7583149.1 Ger(x)C family germination protein [Caldicoprobacter guelmensis]
MRRISTVVLLCTILFMLSSCYDARDINDAAYVLLIGIDRGISDKFRVTFKFPAFEAGGAQGEGVSGAESPGNEVNYKTLTIDAPSFNAALELANTSIPRTLNFMHAQFIVISEDIAKARLVGEFLAPIVRNSSIRYSTRLLIAKKSAAEFVELLEPFGGSDITRMCENLMKQAQETGLFADLTLYDLHDCMTSPYHQPVAVLAAVNKGENFIEKGPKWATNYNIPGEYYAGDVPRKKGSKIELLGLAVFNGDRMVGKLTGHESRLLAMAKGEFKKGTYTIPDPRRPEFNVDLEVREARQPDIKVRFEGGKPFVSLKLYLEGDVQSIQSGIYYETPEMLPVLEKAFEKFIKRELDKTIEKTQRLNCDVFHFGHTAVKHFATIQEWEAYDWNSHYKDAEIYTEVDFKIRRTGTMIYSSKIKYSGEDK